MRITFVSPEYPPADRMGGIGTNTATLAHALAERGHEVSVVTRGERNAGYKDEAVRVERLRHRWIPHRGAETIAARRRIAAAVKKLRPDVVQAAEWEAEAWWLARFGSVPLVTRLATPTYMLEELNVGSLQAGSALVRRLERDQARRSRKVYAPTSAIADRIARDWHLPRETIATIPNSIDVRWVRRAGASEPSRKLPSRYVVFLGRMERRKGIEVMGRALPRMLGACPDVHAVLIGRDPREENGDLMKRFWRDVAPFEDRVHHLGELPRPEALAIVARADVALVPSLWEAFGYVCIEAMALGVPVVASEAGGLVEIVTDGRGGWLVPPGDPEMLAEKMTKVLSSPGDLHHTAAEARARAEEFDVAKIAERVERLLGDALEHPREMDTTIYRSGYRRYFKAEDERDPFHKLYERKRDSVLRHLEGTERRLILDAGGGYGRLSAPLGARHDVVLCDISNQMLSEAAARAPRASLVQCDARTLPFEDGAFDTVVALDLLVHLPDLTASISELARVVRPGGEVVFDTTNSSPWWVPFYPTYWNFRPKRLLLTMLAGGVLPEWRTLVRHQRPAEVRAAIDAAGLRLGSTARFGLRWAAKWHLWLTRKREV